MEDNYAIIALTGIIEDIPNIKQNYMKYENLPLNAIGVDSLNLIQLIMRIEDLASIELDYFNFEVEEINSLNRLNSYIYRLINNEN